jgi:hypothetical protein
MRWRAKFLVVMDIETRDDFPVKAEKARAKNWLEDNCWMLGDGSATYVHLIDTDPID